jgi:hypothetical protein
MLFSYNRRGKCSTQPKRTTDLFRTLSDGANDATIPQGPSSPQFPKLHSSAPPQKTQIKKLLCMLVGIVTSRDVTKGKIRPRKRRRGVGATMYPGFRVRDPQCSLIRFTFPCGCLPYPKALSATWSYDGWSGCEDGVSPYISPLVWRSPSHGRECCQLDITAI